jgi:porin
MRRTALIRSLALVACLLLADAPACLADDQAVPPQTGDLWSRTELTGDWGGTRDRLDKAGVDFGVDWVAQGFDNFRGGIRDGTTAASTLDVNLTLDMGKLEGLTGGTFYADLEDHAGTDPSAELVGDAEKFTKFNYSKFLQVAEIWYQQVLWAGKVRIKAGKVDANSEYSVIDNGLLFLNSSTQVSPTVLTFPTFPDPMPSADLFLTPADWYYASFGAFYANRSDRFLDFVGSPQAAQFASGGTFLIGETGFKWQRISDWQADGNLRLGAWGDTGTFPRLDSGSARGTDGYYAISNQTLWRPTPKPDEARGIRLFLEFAVTPGDVSLIDRHWGGGVAWTGPIADRPDDVLGISPQVVRLSGNARLPEGQERDLEVFYRYQFAGWGSLQPDVQFLSHPGGAYRNAVVGTLQLEFHL